MAAAPPLACVRRAAEALDFSGVVSIAAVGAPHLYARGGGDAPFGTDTRFNLASAGKMFTAVAIGQLIDSGRLRLDDPVGRYVEGLKPATAALTVRQLLTHSSGLPEFFLPENLSTIGHARSVAELMPLILQDTPAFTPGSRFEYSSSGFLLLGRLIERVSGQTYDDYLARHVFAPAGMTGTSLEPDRAPFQRAAGMTNMPAFEPGPETAAGAAPPPGPGPRPLGPPSSGPPQGPLRAAAEAGLRGNPAGGAYSTAGDMQRFFAALTGGRLVSPAMLQAMTSRQIVAFPASATAPELDYGFGFGVGVADGHRWFGHNGGSPGANVETAVFPDDHAALVVMANRDPPVASRLYRQLRDQLLHPAACG